jgi:hypothetical protein
MVPLSDLGLVERESSAYTRARDGVAHIWEFDVYEFRW